MDYLKTFYFGPPQKNSTAKKKSGNKLTRQKFFFYSFQKRNLMSLRIKFKEKKMWTPMKKYLFVTP